jgi:biopolymer transport protein ExbB
MLNKLSGVLGTCAILLAGAGWGSAGETVPAGEVERTRLIELFMSTGVVGVLLLGASLVGTALLIQYLVAIREEKLNNPSLLDAVEASLADGKLDEAFELAGSDSSYCGRILAGALARAPGGYEEALKGLESASVSEAFLLNAQVGNLSLIGNIGPLLGLLGTVTGMISSFQTIATKINPTPADLAVGVYESLVNTTMGLFLAIVFLSAYYFLKNKLSRIMLAINSQAGEVLSRGMAPAAAR